MPSAKTKANTVDYEPFSVPADAGTVLEFALHHDYRGKAESVQDSSGNEVWHIELNKGARGEATMLPPINVTIGDVVVWDGIRLESMPQNVFESKHKV